MDLPDQEWVRRVVERYTADPSAYRDCWAPVLVTLSARLARRLPLGAARRVLDLGAGTGALLPELRGLAPRADVVAADVTEAMLREADPSIPRVVADAQRLPFAAGTFDVVVMAFMLFHLPDPVAGLREARRVLGPGGSVGVATWTDHDLCPPLAAWEEELDAHGAAPTPSLSAHERTDAPEKVRGLVEAAGLEMLSVETARANLRLSRDEFWGQRVRLSTSRERLGSLDEVARAACLAAVGKRLDALPDRAFVDRSEAVLAVARVPG
ncbi:MAG TPA: class I SAM-dependent methyltransferase [Actinomycetota bacterium]